MNTIKEMYNHFIQANKIVWNVYKHGKQYDYRIRFIIQLAVLQTITATLAWVVITINTNLLTSTIWFIMLVFSWFRMGSIIFVATELGDKKDVH